MERRVNYLLVGAFSLVLVAGFTAFVVWAHQRGNGKAITAYAIYFDQAVNGLSLGGSVRYLGVEVGHVQAIALDTAAAPPRVRIAVGIDASVPVSDGTVATLKPSGITGVSFVDLRTDPSIKIPAPAAADKLPVIRSESGGLDRLFDGAADSMQRLDLLLSDDNLTHLHKTLSNLDNISSRMDALLVAHEKSLNRFFGSDLDELGATIKDTHKAVDSFTALGESLNNDPSQLIFR